MARIITVADLREHVEADLAESALQRLLDEADQLVVDRYGAHGGASVEDDLEGSQPYVFLTYTSSSISVVTEYMSATSSKVLSPTDYRVGHGGKSLLRLTTGGTPALQWGPRVTVAYVVAVAQNPRRRRVVIDLVRLALSYNALRSEGAGDYSSQSVNYEQERNRILKSLGGINVV